MRRCRAWGHYPIAAALARGTASDSPRLRLRLRGRRTRPGPLRRRPERAVTPARCIAGWLALSVIVGCYAVVRGRGEGLGGGRGSGGRVGGMSDRAYYNEWERYPAQWMRNLIDAGHIAPGIVDERSITDVRADDLRGFRQVHLFAGLGRLEPRPPPRWQSPTTRRRHGPPRCPCQRVQRRGQGQVAFDDERHLLARRPPTSSPSAVLQCVFGEQASRAALEPTWLDACTLLTWKPWVMPSGRSLSRLASVGADAHPEIGLTGWPTPAGDQSSSSCESPAATGPQGTDQNTHGQRQCA